MFWLKKAVSFWLMPLPFSLALLAAGLALGWSRRRQRLGLRLAAAGAALLILLSNRLVSNSLLGPLETRYPPVPELTVDTAGASAISGCSFIAVLGSGHSAVAGLPATSRLSTSGLARIVEGVRILRLLPEARLVVSGPGDPGLPTHASVLAAAAESLGVDPSRIVRVESARDTEDESHAVAALAAGRRVALVTSAWHMPRAARLFAAAGVNFVPCPADYVARPASGARWSDLGCDCESLGRSTLAVHEWLGLAWLRLRGVG